VWQGIVGFLEGSRGFEGCGVSSSAAVSYLFLPGFLWLGVITLSQ
jgi:hypothetical protein